MAPKSCNDGGPPPPRGRRDSLSDNDPIEDQDSSGEEDENAEISSDSDESEDEELIIPPDPVHEALMASLRAENQHLMEIVAQQDVVLAQMAQRTEEIRQATAQRQQDLDELRAARAEREEKAEKEKQAEEKQKNGKGCQPPEAGRKDEEGEGSSPIPI